MPFFNGMTKRVSLPGVTGQSSIRTKISRVFWTRQLLDSIEGRLNQLKSPLTLPIKKGEKILDSVLRRNDKYFNVIPAKAGIQSFEASLRFIQNAFGSENDFGAKRPPPHHTSSLADFFTLLTSTLAMWPLLR